MLRSVSHGDFKFSAGQKLQTLAVRSLQNPHLVDPGQLEAADSAKCSQVATASSAEVGAPFFPSIHSLRDLWQLSCKRHVARQIVVLVSAFSSLCGLFAVLSHEYLCVRAIFTSNRS